MEITEKDRRVIRGLVDYFGESIAAESSDMTDVDFRTVTKAVVAEVAALYLQSKDAKCFEGFDAEDRSDEEFDENEYCERMDAAESYVNVLVERFEALYAERTQASV